MGPSLKVNLSKFTPDLTQAKTSSGVNSPASGDLMILY